jgi:anaerobic selenocysteine-containing dehydrogenase
MSIQIGTDTAAAWRPSACILCECNCGILVRLGGDNGRRFEQIRGDKAHPASKGYTCQKALRLDHYQNGRGERVLEPLRRRADGSFETIDWPTAIGEVTARLHSVRETYGGETILYYGGGGQGNHLGGFYSAATLRAFGAKFRSSAIEQEKTGEAWVNGLMFGTPVRGEFEHCEVALFIGKNPWQSHSFPHARLTLRNIAKDPARSMIVIDPRRTETAELADIHLRVRPGRDAWLLAALAAVLVDENLTNRRGSPSMPRGSRTSWQRWRPCRSPSTAGSAGSTRPWCGPPRAASVERRAWRCSRILACR